jgi:Restriction endonuclease
VRRCPLTTPNRPRVLNPIRKLARNVQTISDSWRGITSAGVTALWLPEEAERTRNALSTRTCWWLAICDPDPLRRGRQFERICLWFLTHDPVYAHELRHVWLWKDWPGRWGIDAGIDLVAEDHHGHLWAIQAKAYDEATWITKRDVDTFLAESGRSVFSFRLLIATTNLID